MKQSIKLSLFATLLGVLTVITNACSEDADCSKAARPMLQCYLYHIDPITGNTLKDTLKEVSITALETDSIIINRQQNVKDLSLPLQYSKEQTSLVFHYDEKLTDTITFTYTNTPYFLSLDCAYQIKQALTEVHYTRHKLDSIFIKDNVAGIYGKENIQLFY